MSEILDSHQERLRKLPAGTAESPPELAVVRGRHDDGLELLIDGAQESDSKHYAYNLAADKALPFARGMRVLVRKVGRTYVVICPVGPVREEGTGGERLLDATMEKEVEA